MQTIHAARILLVEDELDLVFLLEASLTRAGFQVTTCAAGHLGLASARHDPPELLILDWMLPGLDGLEVLASLRADPRTRELPVLLISGRGGNQELFRALAAGADDCLLKPFTGQELVARARALLSPTRPLSAR